MNKKVKIIIIIGVLILLIVSGFFIFNSPMIKYNSNLFEYLKKENEDRIVEALEIANKYSDGYINVLINDLEVSIRTPFKSSFKARARIKESLTTSLL